MSLYLVIGGRGRTGRRVSDLLVAAGHDVRILSRSPGATAGTRTHAVAGNLARLKPDDAAFADIAGAVVSVEPPYDAAGAEAVLHRGVATVGQAVTGRHRPVVLVSQIYVTRPEAYPQMAEVTRARGRGENALRHAGTGYAIVRPGWLTDEPATGVRLEQGDTGDGPVSRDTIAAACVHAVLNPPATGVTFEVFDDRDAPPAAWADLFTSLTPDHPD